MAFLENFSGDRVEDGVGKTQGEKSSLQADQDHRECESHDDERDDGEGEKC